MRLLRGLLPLVAATAAVAAAAVAAAGLPAAAAVVSPANAGSPPNTGSAATTGSPVTTGSPSSVTSAAGNSIRPVPWWLSALQLPAGLRDTAAAGHGVTVAVLSTGVDASHPDLAGSVTSGPDFSQTGRKPGGEYWGDEGTAVASLIAGHGHGGSAEGMTGTLGITGVAPGARILSVQVTLEYDDPLNAEPAVTRRLPDAIAEGIRYAVGHGATVIALPLDPGTLGISSSGGETAAAGGSAAEQSAVRYALSRNVVLIAPAGDNGAEGNAVNYPAGYPGVIAAGATARAGTLAPFSGIHSYVGLTAPGSGDTPASPAPGGTVTNPAAGLTVAAPGGGYQALASTDMSAALTAGVAALVRSRYPRLTAAQVTQAIEHSATAPPGATAQPGAAAGPGRGRGHGALDATAALTAAAAIAAAHPAPPAPASTSGSASPGQSRSAQAGRPRVSAPASAATPRAQDPGHLLRSLVVDLAVAAAALIACLTGAIALIRLRRRRARAASRPASRPGGVPSGTGAPHAPARHARKQPNPAKPPAPLAPPAPPAPPTPFTPPAPLAPPAPAPLAPPAAPASPVPKTLGPPCAPKTPSPPLDAAAGASALRVNPESPGWPGAQAEPPGWPGTNSGSRSRPGDTEASPVWPGGGGRPPRLPLEATTGAVPPVSEVQPRRRVQEEPPWPPAPPPGHRVTPEAFLPAEPVLPAKPGQPAKPGLPANPGQPPDLPRADLRWAGLTPSEQAPADLPLAPWEKFPGDFARREDDRLLWGVSGTGPMFVWNPTAATGPLGIIRDNPDDPASDPSDGGAR